MYHVRMWAGYGNNSYPLWSWAYVNRECPIFFGTHINMIKDHHISDKVKVKVAKVKKM